MFSNDGGHIERKLSLKWHFCVFYYSIFCKSGADKFLVENMSRTCDKVQKPSYRSGHTETGQPGPHTARALFTGHHRYLSKAHQLHGEKKYSGCQR